MSTIVTRAGKGSALTWTEGDANITNLNTDKYQSGDSPSFAAVTNGGVLATGFTSSYSYIIGMGAVPVAWENFGTTYGYQLGTNAFWTNTGNTYTLLSHGMRVNSAGDQVYTTTGVSPVWLSLSGGTFYIYGATSGTAGDTISALLPTFSVDATTDTVAINNNNISAENSLGFRNRIINGNISVHQRGVDVLSDSGAYEYGPDMWAVFCSGGGQITFGRQSSAGGVAGHAYYLRNTVTTADASVAAGDAYTLRTCIEGTNWQDLDFGYAAAKSVTLSFWVRATLTGAHSVGLRNGTRGYATTFTVNATNTWEYKTITIPGDTSGTWAINTDKGAEVIFDLGSGTNFETTADTWSTNTDFRVAGSVRTIGTLNNILDVTGVQLEAGSIATPFERRPYGTELALCQRYFYQWNGKAGVDTYVGMSFNQNTTLAYCHMPFPVPLRSDAITLGTTGTATHYSILQSSGGVTCSVVPAIAIANTNGCLVSFTVAAGLTAGQGSSCYIANGASRYISFSAEY